MGARIPAVRDKRLRSAGPRSRAVPVAALRLRAHHASGSATLRRPPTSLAPAKSRTRGCWIGPGLQKPREREGSLPVGFLKK